MDMHKLALFLACTWINMKTTIAYATGSASCEANSNGYQAATTISMLTPTRNFFDAATDDGGFQMTAPQYFVKDVPLNIIIEGTTQDFSGFALNAVNPSSSFTKIGYFTNLPAGAGVPQFTDCYDPNDEGIINTVTHDSASLKSSLTLEWTMDADLDQVRIELLMYISPNFYALTHDISVLPTPLPTSIPTALPTISPTTAPTESPTDAPTDSPTDSPTSAPTESPTDAPTDAPTSAPTDAPTSAPTNAPSEAPSGAPTNAPTSMPTDSPTEAPTEVEEEIVEEEEEEEEIEEDEESAEVQSVQEDDTGLSDGEIAAIVGAIIGFFIVLGILFCCHKNRQNHRYGDEQVEM